MHNQRHPFRALMGLILIACLQFQASSQTQKRFNQNSSRSGNPKTYLSSDDRFLIGLRTGTSLGLNSNAASLFRGNGIGSDLYANYYFGPFGLGVTSGWLQGNLSNSAINQFLTDRKYPTDAVITKGDPSNSYFLFGPSVRFGKRVQLNASLQGGLFMNHSGRLIIAQNGAARPLYRFDEGSKSMAPGFSGNLQADYPINASTHFTLQTGFLQSHSSTLLLDPQGGIDQPREFNKDLRMLSASIGISKSLGSTKRLLPTVNKRLLPTVNKKEIVSPRDAQSGLPTGRRSRVFEDKKDSDIAIDEPGVQRNGTTNVPRDAQSGLPTGRRSSIAIDEPGVQRMMPANGPSCGPVTIKSTNTDGTTNEMTFACPSDAATYQNRISMNVTVPKQTQGATFGEKVNAGLHAAGGALASGRTLRPTTAPHVIIGRISLSGENALGIETNQSNSKTLSAGGGASTAAYASTGFMIYNNPGTSTHFFARDMQSGQASGKRTYQPFYAEDDPSVTCAGCNAKSSNPLYKGMGNVSSNPLYNDKDRIITPAPTALNNTGIEVQLIDPTSDAILATTTTDPDGTFYFINVPEGNYALAIHADIHSSKDYTVDLGGKKDLAGILSAEADSWLVDISTSAGGLDSALAIVKTKTKSNQSNDRVAGSGMVWSPRSNIVAFPISGGDLDGDGIPEFATRDYFQNGDIPTQTQFLQRGEPVSGIKVFAIQNGASPKTTQTNEFGEFEFTGLDAGSFMIRTSQNFLLHEIIMIGVNDEGAVDTEIGSADGKYKGTHIVATQNSQSLRQTGNGAVKVTASQNSQSLRQAGNDVEGDLNRKTEPKASASQNAQTLRSVNGINNNMPNRISMNFTVARQTRQSSFGEKVQGIIEADTDGDGTFETSWMNFNGEVATLTFSGNGSTLSGLNITEPGVPHTLSVGQKTAAPANKLPIRWSAPEVLKLKHVSGDPHVDQASGMLMFGNDPAQTLQKEKWKGTEVAVKTLVANDGVALIITAHPEDFPDAIVSLNGLPPGTPVRNAEIMLSDNNGREIKGTTDVNGACAIRNIPANTSLGLKLNIQVPADEDVIFILRENSVFSSISNVLKTKHDTVKNSISNIR